MDTRFRLSLLLLAVAVVLSLTTCTGIKISGKKDNGKHKGWYKNTNNPHHPLTTNPGHTKSKPASSGPAKHNAKAKK